MNESTKLLSEMQQGHYESIRWLYSTAEKDIGSGRSTVLAHVFIDQALDRVGEWVEVHSHIVTGQCVNSCLFRMITSVFDRAGYARSGYELQVHPRLPRIKIVQFSCKLKSVGTQ